MNKDDVVDKLAKRLVMASFQVGFVVCDGCKKEIERPLV